MLKAIIIDLPTVYVKRQPIKYCNPKNVLKDKVKELGMAILILFTFGRGWGHDVIVSRQLSKEEGITVKILHFHGLAL